MSSTSPSATLIPQALNDESDEDMNLDSDVDHHRNNDIDAEGESIDDELPSDHHVHQHLPDISMRGDSVRTALSVPSHVC